MTYCSCVYILCRLCPFSSYGNPQPWIYIPTAWRASGKRFKVDSFVSHSHLSAEVVADVLQCSVESLKSSYRFYLQASRGYRSTGAARVGSVIEINGASPRCFLLLGVVQGRSTPLSFFGLPCTALPRNAAFPAPPLHRLNVPRTSADDIPLLIPFLPNCNRVQIYPTCSYGCLPDNIQENPTETGCPEHYGDSSVPVFAQDRRSGYPPNSA